MEYLEIIESIVPYVIKRIMMGVEDHIYAGQEITSSAKYTVNLAFEMMYQQCFNPYFQNQQDNSDTEAISTQKERMRAYDIGDHIQKVPKYGPKIELPPPHKFNQPTQIWEDYEPSLIKQKPIEYIEEYPNERRIMEQKCIEKQNKEEMLRQRSREKRQMKEQYTRRIQQIGSKEYTYDYNCEPIAKNSSQNNKQVFQEVPFDVPLTDNNAIISKPKLIEQIKQKRRQIENEDTIIEFIECQPHEIKLQPGVKMNLIPILTLRKQSTSQPKQDEVHSSCTGPKKYKRHQNIVKLNDLQLVSYLQQLDLDCTIDTNGQNTNKTQIVTPTNRSLIDQQSIKQDVLKLPKLRSHSINVRTKRQYKFIL